MTTSLKSRFSDETRKKMSEAGKVKFFTAEHRANMGNSRRGKTHSDETKHRMSLNHRRGQTEATKQKIRESRLSLIASGWVNPIKGRLSKLKGIKRPERSGDKSGAWKGGITEENTKIRFSEAGKTWRRACLERDMFTCQKTGKKGIDLVVHHIRNFAEFPELRTEMSNGITLSVDSHKEFHRIYGRTKNTLEQLKQFLS